MGIINGTKSIIQFSDEKKWRECANSHDVRIIEQATARKCATWEPTNNSAHLRAVILIVIKLINVSNVLKFNHTHLKDQFNDSTPFRRFVKSEGYVLPLLET